MVAHPIDFERKQLVFQTEANIEAYKFSAANKLIDEMLSLDKDDSKAWQLKLKLNRRNGNDEVALETSKQILKRDPDCIEAITTLSEHLLSSGQVDECETHLLNAIKTAQAPAPLESLLSSLYFQQGYRFKATRLLQSALATEPDNIDITIRLAWVLGRDGDADASFNILQPLLELEEPPFEAVILFSNLCFTLNMVDDGLLLLDKVSHSPLTSEQRQQIKISRETLTKCQF